jgi:photosystem II stability/assembly factor-like uncharacterized protein
MMSRTALRPLVLLVAVGAFALPLSAGVNRWTRIGPYGGTVLALAAAPSRPGLVYAGLEPGGVFRSPDAGRTWIFAGGGLVDTRVNHLAVHPRLPTIAYAATDRGVFKTNDAGASWARISGDLWFTRVAVDPRSPRFVYAAPFGGPLLRSADSGATFVGLQASPHGVVSIAIDPSRSQTVYAAGGGAPFRSTDRGATWTRIDRGLPAGFPADLIAVDPRSPRTLFVAAAGEGWGLFKSTDGGATWKPSQRGLGLAWVDHLAFDPAGATLYAVIARDGIVRILTSGNGGATWRPTGAPPEGHLPGALLATRFGLLAGTYGRGVLGSSDRGATWQPSNDGLSALQISAFAIGDQSPPRLYAGDRLAGLFKSADRGAHWLRLNTELGLDAFWFTGPVEVHPLAPLTVYAAFFRGFARSDNGGRRWQPFDMGCFSPSRLVLDPTTTETVYVSGSFVLGACHRQPGACSSFKVTPAGSTCLRDPALAPVGVAVLAVDPHAPGHLYAVVYVGVVPSLYHSTDDGGSWSLLAPGVAPGVLVFDAAQPGVVYGGFQGVVGRSTDGGATWELSGEGLPALYQILSLTIDPTDPTVLYVPLSGAGVFRSRDAGRTWSEVAPGLAGLPLWKVLVDPEDPSILYARPAGRAYSASTRSRRLGAGHGRARLRRLPRLRDPLLRLRVGGGETQRVHLPGLRQRRPRPVRAAGRLRGPDRGLAAGAVRSRRRRRSRARGRRAPSPPAGRPS